MKKVTNHKGWLTAILSIIPFFIFVSFFQGFGVGLSTVLGERGVIDFDFDKYLEIEDMRDFLVADTIIQYFDLIGVLLLLWILMRFVDKEPFIKLGFSLKGKINDIPGFLEVSTNQFMNNEIKRYVGASGTSQLSIGGNSSNGLPDRFTTYPNFPNPFNPTTQIQYDLPKDRFVSIAIYDVIGRNIRSLTNANQTAGYHSIYWDAKNDFGEGVAAGMYIYTIQAGEFRATKKMVLLK